MHMHTECDEFVWEEANYVLRAGGGAVVVCVQLTTSSADHCTTHAVGVCPKHAAEAPLLVLVVSVAGISWHQAVAHCVLSMALASAAPFLALPPSSLHPVLCLCGRRRGVCTRPIQCKLTWKEGREEGRRGRAVCVVWLFVKQPVR